MKKIVSLVLVAVLCLTLCIPALAANGQTEVEYNGQESSTDVKVTISGDVIHVYYVEIEFTSNPVFTYSTGSKWDPDQYQYVPSDTATWAGEGSVKITNHSDLPVNYTVAAQNVVTTFGPLTIDVTGESGTIEKCEVGTAYGSMNATATYSVSGTPTVSEINAQKLGEILVTITK